MGNPEISQHFGRFEKGACRHFLPGNLYLIRLAGENKAYVGEAKDICNRLRQHISAPEEKIRNWNRALIITDGRAASLSDFSDESLRKSLEFYLIRLLKANKMNVVAQGEESKLNTTAKFLAESYKAELDFFLLKKGVITRILEERGQEEVHADELEKLLVRAGKIVTDFTAKETRIDGQKAFIRPGSKKRKGWQITIRGRQPGSFIDCLNKGEGYLLVSRNGVLLIPLSKVKEVINDEKSFERDTIDIWIVFTEDSVKLTYKENSLDVSEYRFIS